MNTPVSTLMHNYFFTVGMNFPIEKVERIFRIHKHSFAVVTDEDGNFFGLITAATMLRFHMAWKKTGALTAGEISTQNVSAVGPLTDLKTACEVLLRRSAEFLVVMENDEVLGILTPQNLLRYTLMSVDPQLRSNPAEKGFFAGPL